MGLSGRKQKQKIPNDPRNLTWADDASRFGSSYLSKFGWDSSKGLGATGEGMTSHIKVSQKLDMMGIGAAHQKDPNGIAWKQNRDFENLLRRLNADSGSAEARTTVDVEMKEEFVAETTGQEGEGGKDEEERKKEKREKKKKKKEKESKKENKLNKKRKHDGDHEDISEKKKPRKASEQPSEKEIQTEPTPATAKQPAPPRYRAHRARAIAAKSISHKSSVHISEILGIAPSASTSESTSAIASGLATPAEQGKLTVISELEKLTTSTKTVADYFKEKLLLKSSKVFSAISTPVSSSESSTPPTTLSTSDYEDRPAGGLGFGAGGLGFGGGGLGFSKMRVEVKEECNVVEEATMRMGLSKFSSLMSSKFLASETLGFHKESATPEPSESKVEEVANGEESSSSEEEETREERKRRRKAEKEKKRTQAELKGKKSKDKKEKKEKKAKGREGSGEKPKTKDDKERERAKKLKKIEDA